MVQIKTLQELKREANRLIRGEKCIIDNNDYTLVYRAYIYGNNDLVSFKIKNKFIRNLVETYTDFDQILDNAFYQLVRFRQPKILKKYIRESDRFWRAAEKYSISKHGDKNWFMNKYSFKIDSYIPFLGGKVRI